MIHPAGAIVRQRQEEGMRMRFATFRRGDTTGLAAAAPGGGFHGLLATDANFPGTLDSLVAAGPEALKAAGQALLSAPASIPSNCCRLWPAPARSSASA
jgi:hypothetical protein